LIIAVTGGYDEDLLAKEKPFGIEIIRPAQFLKLVKG